MGASISLDAVKNAYLNAGGILVNEQLYQVLAESLSIDEAEFNRKASVGRDKSPHSLLKRQVRWHQQTLKRLGVLERDPTEKGLWSLTEEAKGGLKLIKPGISLLAYSTNLGLAIWGDNQTVLNEIDVPVTLCITSPPYPLRTQRHYGNVDESAWVDFICTSLEPVLKLLVDGGSIVLNVSNDIFNKKSPSRSLYLEKMTIALNERLGLELMDRHVWENPSKPPSPTWWACRNPIQLCTGYEPVLWFTNNPLSVTANNRNVLEPHTEQHKQFLANGGNQREVQYGDGAYTLRKASFSNVTEGKIPKNVIKRGHACKDTRALRQHAKALNLPAHSAMFPTSLVDFYIDYLTIQGDTVLDLFSGSNKVGLSAERKGRQWIAIERVLQYIRVQAEMFKEFDGFSMSSWMK